MGWTAGKALFVALAAPAVWRSARRVARLEGRLAFDRLVDELRRAPRFALPGLAHPRYLRGTVERLLPWLPPRRYGPCLKRSLILLDLWSRCGLEPKLHLGFKGVGRPDFEGHAWLSAVDRDGGDLATSTSPVYTKAFEF